MPCPVTQVPACSASHGWRTKVVSHTYRQQRVSRCRRAFQCKAKPETRTAEQPAKTTSPSDRTEEQADAEAKEIVEEADAAGDDAKAEKIGNEVRVTKSSGEKIYLGFQKGDYDRSKPGRVIDDDPSKYPDRNQTVGGWAGGEKGLQEFIEREQKELSASKAVVKDQSKESNEGKKPVVKKQEGGTIYIGFEKDDYEGKRAGGGGRTISGDPEQYPSRNALSGGFAGGEAGLQQFLEGGEIKFRDPNDKSNRNFNILAFAGLLAVGTTVGGILLTDAVDVGEFGFKGATEQLQQLTSKPTDENSKLLLKAVLGLFGVTATGVVVRTAFRSIAGKVTRGSLNVAKLAIFWTGVFIAARFVLESN